MFEGVNVIEVEVLLIEVGVLSKFVVDLMLFYVNGVEVKLFPTVVRLPGTFLFLRSVVRTC